MFNHRMLLAGCSVEPGAQQVYFPAETQQDVRVFVPRGTDGHAHMVCEWYSQWEPDGIDPTFLCVHVLEPFPNGTGDLWHVAVWHIS